MRADETHQANFLTFDIGLPVVELRQPILDILNGGQSRTAVILPATSRRGRSIECKVSMTPLRGADSTATGVILFMEDMTTEKLA